MKKYIVTLKLLIVLVILAKGQTLVSDFQEYDVNGCVHAYYQGFDAFRKGCVGNNWKVSHGTPDAFAEGNYPYSGNKFAGLYAGIYNNAIGSEGIYYQGFTFLPYNEYTLSFKVLVAPTGQGAVTTVQNTYVKLANSLPVQTASNAITTTIPSVAQSQLIKHLQNISNTSWQTITFTFHPDRQYNQLWFYLYSANVNVDNGIYVELDDIQITNTTLVGDHGCCTPNITYSNTSALPIFSNAAYTVTASTNTNVLSGQDVLFQAGDAVHLNPGFYAQSSGQFLAFIAPCTPTAVTADAGPDKMICSNDPPYCTQIGVAPNPYVTYTWTAQDPEDLQWLSATNISNPMVCWPTQDYFNARVAYYPYLHQYYTLTASSSCASSSTTDQVIVTYVMFGAGSCGARMGVVDTEDLSVAPNCYPNPSDGKFTIRIPSGSQHARAVIKDINGKEMLTKQLNQTQTEVELNIPRGVYILTIESAGETIHDKIIIQ